METLPALISECEDRWRIRVGPPFELSFNYVAPAVTLTGQEVVVKLGVPNTELTTEIEALRLYDGNGAVRLLDADQKIGFLLMERLVPGRLLSSIDDDGEAAQISAETMRKLWTPSPPKNVFPSVVQWADGLKRLRKRFNRGTGPFPDTLVEMAASLFSELLSSAEPPLLLHGDLHHFNILSAGDRWVAIDPKGVLGEPAFEVGAFLENPISRLFTDINVQRRRVEIFCSELGLDRGRVLGYGVARAVLSAWWSYEDSSSEWKSQLQCAEVLSRLMEQK